MSSVFEADESLVARSTMRKAGRRLLPLLGVGYGIAYMDRVNISFAALEMNRDLHFSATAYGLGAGLFFVSYAICEIPSNILMVRVGARRWLARIMLTWGLLAAAMMLVRTPAQFYAARFLLGVAEAGFFPGIIFYLTQWFPARMRARAISRFYIALPLSSVVMGGIAGALLNLDGTLGLAGWQWLFLVEGLPAVLMSMVFLRFLPDTPADAAWLSVEERDWLLRCLQAEETSAAEASHGEALSALANKNTWLMGLFMLFMLAGLYAYTFSGPIIVRDATGFSPSGTGFIIAAIGLLQAVSMLWAASHADRAGERFWHIVIPCAVMAAGFLLSGLTHSALLVVPSLAAAAIAYCAMQGPLWAFASGLAGRSGAAVGIAAMNMIGMCGGFLGPYWMGRMHDLTHNYQRALMTAAIAPMICIALLYAMRPKGTAM